MPTNKFVSLFLLFLNSVNKSYQDSLHTLSRYHYEHCECLIGTDDFFDKSLEIVHSDCWAKCFTTPNCFAFEYCDVTKICKLYDSMSVGVNAESVLSDSCKNDGKYSSSEIYLIKRFPDGETFDCADIKSKDSSVIDGYFNIKIRGVDVQVYCLMTNDPPATYIDVDARSIWGGSPYDWILPQFSTTRTWTKARILVDKCLIQVKADDRTFSEADAVYEGSDADSAYLWAQNFAFGGGCFNSPKDAEAFFNLSSTPFFVPTGVYFKLTGADPIENKNELNSERQILHLSGTANCGSSELKHERGGTSLNERVPLFLNRR
ncbi:uncharacterized protein LOC142338487 [Convolutriloba macropyga]|uniref:uncharacterized protein LOC142338487 n=1 Tax=Convolutriloba macropyga TaxID=536237 RepID=UPI003F52383C